MRVDTVRAIFFSPTGSTGKIVKGLLSGMDIGAVKFSDLTLPRDREAFNADIGQDIVLIAVPVYVERIPEEIARILRTIRGNGVPAIICAVYGNVGYGKSLLELYDICRLSKLRVIAAGAFVAEHSFSGKSIKLACGRPNGRDIQQALEFGRNIIERADDWAKGGCLSRSKIRGRIPSIFSMLPKDGAKRITFAPVINESCSHCSACVASCPAGAISEDLSIDDGKCIRCCACVRKCGEGAREIRFKKKKIMEFFFNHLGAKDKDNHMIFS